jgi:predicted ATP-grasp superfamily ATP-dependent carboligase
LIGTEPSLRWRAFCAEVVDLAHHLGATRVVHLGALLADVPHSRPVPVSVSGSTTTRPADRPSYQGPTGIVGILHHACTEAGLESVSLWASVPTYVSGASSPKAALALVRHVSDLIETPVATGLLEISAQSYEVEIDQLVEDDEDTAAYVQRLEHDYDAEVDVVTADGLTDEIERYLRDRRT